MDDRACVWKLFAHAVVVGNDEFYCELAAQLGFLDRTDATIDADDHFASALR